MLEFFGQRGFRAVAVDLPGFGGSERIGFPFPQFLALLLPALELERPALVSPSMSGRFSLPFVVEHPDRLRAFLPVAPAGVATYAGKLFDSPVRTLVLWGAEDSVFPVAQADQLAGLFVNARTAILPGTGHACYVDDPAGFQQRIVAFLAPRR